jgi:integrase
VLVRRGRRTGGRGGATIGRGDSRPRSRGGVRQGVGARAAATDITPKLVQALARHADIRTTMNRYAYTRNSAASAAMQRVMPDLAGGRNAKNKGNANGRKRKS